MSLRDRLRRAAQQRGETPPPPEITPAPEPEPAADPATDAAAAPVIAKSAADIRAMLAARGVSLPDRLRDARPQRQRGGLRARQERDDEPPAEPITRDRLATFRALQGAVGTGASLAAERANRFSALTGEVHENAEGSFLLQRHAYPLDHRHGTRALSDALGVSPERLVSITGDPAIARFDLARTFFFDTETTSLNTGAGVHVFQIGAAYLWPGPDGWDAAEPGRTPAGAPTHAVVDQYFMRDFGEERAMLAEFDRFCATRTSVVSFFGKSFDAHRLRDRMAFHGLENRFPGTAHVDLCHLARALWRQKYESVKLQFLEREVLGFERDDDLPGSECPAAYFRFVRTGETADVHRIFEHNRLDTLSLIVLMAEIDARVASTTDPLERYALAQVYRRFGDHERNLEALQDTLALLEGEAVPGQSMADAVLGEELAGRSRWEVSLAYKKAGRYAEAVPIWEGLASAGNSNAIAPLIELAKHAEHKAKDPVAALAHAERALAIAMREIREGSPMAQESAGELRDRIARLRKRAGRGGPAAPEDGVQGRFA